MLYLVVEHFRDGDPRPVYARAREHGRRMPGGLRHVARRSDLVDLEVNAVVTSAEAAARAAAG